tara:strand:+ start:304 stop:549 length:246 start_codon:yes stop_codon:yes gene_type:complete
MQIEITRREFNLIQNICKRDRSTLDAFQLFVNHEQKLRKFDNSVLMKVRNVEKTQAWILEQAKVLPFSLFKQFERIEKELV